MKLQFVNVKAVKGVVKDHEFQIASEALVALDKKVHALLLEVIAKHQNKTRISATEVELVKM